MIFVPEKLREGTGLIKYVNKQYLALFRKVCTPVIMFCSL